jgi:hypothetical protein
VSQISLKQGDTFYVKGVYLGQDGNPVYLPTAGITITSKVLSEDGQQHYDLEVTLDNQISNLGGYIIQGDTTTWTPGEFSWDIRFTLDDGRSFSLPETYRGVLHERIS